MKKRHPAAVLLLPIVTLGIYCIYWLYATRKELLQVSGNGKNSIPPVLVLLLPAILLVGLLISMLVASGDLTGTPVDTESEAPLGVAGIVTMVIIIGFFIGGILLLPLWWFWRYCKVAVQATRGKGMDFTQLYVLYVVIVWLCGIPPVWMLIAQLDFNKIADSGEGQPHDHAGHPGPKPALPAA